MRGTPLTTLAPVIRSKNAGPTLLTLDLFFRDADAYDQAVVSTALSTQAVADLYCQPQQDVLRFDLPDILAIKFSLPRAVCAGSPGDGDVYGAQQHGPLLGVML